MAIVGQLMVLVSMNNAPLLAGMATTEGALKGFAGRTSATLAILRTAAIGVGVGVVAGLGLGVKAASDFQAQMATVNTIARLTPEALAALGTEVRGIATATGIGLPDLTQGLYDLLSVGVPVGEAIKFLGDSATLSIGGVSSAGEAVNAITTAINSWSIAGGEANLTMADSGKVMDIFAKTVEIGGLTAAEIPGALANVASSAAALNVPLEEVGAAWAILTTRGFTASEAATSMDAALTALQKVPPGMQKLQDATGKSYEQIARTEGAQAAMQELVTDAQKFGVQLVDVFGRKEALGYARNITDAGAPAFKAALDAMFDSSGTAVGQAGERMGTLDRQVLILGASLNELGITIGTALLAPLTTFVQNVNGAIQAIGTWVTSGQSLATDFAPVIETVVGKFAALWQIVQDVGIVIMDLASRIWEGGLNKAVGSTASLIGSVIDVIGGIATAILENEDTMNILKTAADLIGAGFGIVADAIDKSLTFLGQLGDNIRDNETAMAVLAKAGDLIAGAFGLVRDVLKTIIDYLTDIIDLAAKALAALGLVDGSSAGKKEKGKKNEDLGLFAEYASWFGLEDGAPAPAGDKGLFAEYASWFKNWNLPGFATGGIVPGPLGAPVLGIVHGGETITPAGRGGGGTLIVMMDGREISRVVDDRLAVREGLVTVLRPGTR